MNKLSFINLPAIYFPGLFKSVRKYLVYTSIINFFESVAIAKNDQQVVLLSKQYEQFIVVLSNAEQVYYEEALKSLKQALNLSLGLIENSLKTAISLDMKISFLIKQKDKNVPRYALHCAILSMIGVLSERDIDKKNLKEHFILQQRNLNYAIQSHWEDKNSVNYWYALHYYLQNNEKNTQFFLKSFFNNMDFHDKQLLIDNNQSLWLKKKIPLDFHNYVLNFYKKWKLS